MSTSTVDTTDDAPVFTGIGVVAPNGTGTEEYWRATLEGRSGLGPLTGFDTDGYDLHVAGHVTGFDATPHLPARVLAETDRWTRMGLVAAGWALADAHAGAAGWDPYEVCVMTASSSGGNELGQREIQKLWHQGPGQVSVYQSIGWFYAATTGQASIRHGFKGSCSVLVAEQAGGLDALAQARRALREGHRAVLTGGTEAPLSPYAVTCQLPTGTLSPARDPARAYLPFDERAAGWVPGEGGAMFVLEHPRAAGERGAPHRYGRLAGHAAGFAPDGAGRRVLDRVVRLALDDAGLPPAHVDAVFADASARPGADADESRVLADVFGPHGVPVTAPKTMTGRLYAGGAALDVAAALLALRDQVLPPTAGVRRPAAHHRLDLVLRTRPARLRNVLVLARGEGGFVSACVLSR
ncbi:beta-ketoacyl synthase N-terminal-like domain-containing protein [Streptomyces cinnamoneus]|uniref:Actinorhodin polyketide beta-ketoacyl synthase n=1 Tax=Streptomyces cinnamoneus TaxID=53446 RepID=A0A918TCN0_STRCJ|nr:beta-ketoacyl synthase N-terminal-like domain-containing protein [Streptomyces cinnamoneus]GHC39197.1 actinorhodin polyketide beta-ketoacyl synthase [Streptomyces cinnamoneus]